MGPWRLRFLRSLNYYVEMVFTCVNPFMHFQVVLLAQASVTVVAMEWFLWDVKPFMHSQVSLCFRWQISCQNGGNRMIYSSVNPLMHSWVILPDQLLVTVVAVEWFRSNVNAFMHSLIITVLADECLLSNVNPLKHSQVVLVAKFLWISGGRFFITVLLLYSWVEVLPNERWLSRITSLFNFTDWMKDLNGKCIQIPIKMRTTLLGSAHYTFFENETPPAVFQDFCCSIEKVK